MTDEARLKQSGRVARLYTGVFIAVVMLVGLISLFRWMRFYIRGDVNLNDLNATTLSQHENDLAYVFFGRHGMINLNGAIRTFLGERQMNGVVKLNNGWLSETYGYSAEETLQEYADRVIALHDYLGTSDCPLLFVATPYTISPYDTELPTGVVDVGNENIDRFLELLRDAKVETLDLRAEMRADGIDQYEMMYRTDHHWTTRAGLYAYGKIETWLREKLQCKVDPRIAEMENYTVTAYEKWHLGSRGQRTGAWFGGIDDFELILPKFDTLIQGEESAGSMPELVMSMQPLERRDSASRYTYDRVYINALEHYRNLRCENDKKLLIVTDSMGKAVNPYLIMGFGEVRTLHNSYSADLTPEYVDDYAPDAVVLLYYPELLLEGYGRFDFQGF